MNFRLGDADIVIIALALPGSLLFALRFRPVSWKGSSSKRWPPIWPRSPLSSLSKC